MTLGNIWRLCRGAKSNVVRCFVHRKHNVIEGVALQSPIPRKLSDIPSQKAGCPRDPCLPTPSFGPQEEESLPRHHYRSQSFCSSPTEGLRHHEAPLPWYLPLLISAWCFVRRHFPHRRRLRRLRLRLRRSPPPRRMSPIQFPRGLFLQPMPERRHHHPRRPRINMWHTLRPDRRRDTLFLG